MSLQELAEDYGITTSHTDGLGRQQTASDDALISTLQALGVDITAADQATRLRDEARQAAHPIVEPCHATRAWQGTGVIITGDADAQFRAELIREDSQQSVLEGRFGDLPSQDHGWRLDLGALPPGYHTLTLSSGERKQCCRVFAAPQRAYGAPDGRREWGVFAPLYALRSDGDLGVGDFSTLNTMMDWAGELGASFLGTLPLLAANYREAFQTSPYSPVSRLFWNELYLDIHGLAERYPSPELSALLKSKAFRDQGDAAADLEFIDYKQSSELRRQVLEHTARIAWQTDAARFDAALSKNPELRKYAQFRATMEKTGQTWPQWAAPQRDGELSEADYTATCFRYFAFVQVIAEEQLGALSEKDCQLYLDLSVGAAGSSYDVWRYRQQFVTGIDIGAPPDDLFEGGQNWALPPLHPQRSREHGHDYFIECVRAHMRHAGVLRIDHIMGLHRLYWVPSELGATEGLYVNYPADELYAILLIESHRLKCAVVGEDLGTVPDYVRPMMGDAGMHRLYVGQFATQWCEEDKHLGLQVPPAGAIASLDTHDTATFAGWFATTDLEVPPKELMESWTEELAAGPVAGLMVTLEDLWLEAEPQNRPGSGLETPNWRHRMARTAADIRNDVVLCNWLRKLDGLRRQSQD